MEKHNLFQSLNIEKLNGIKLALSGQTPLLINDPEQILLVLKGYVNIFAVSLSNGEPAGVRSHVLRVETGNLIPGIPITQNPKSLLAVGAIGTEILKVSRSALANQSQSAVAALIDEWVIDISTMLVDTKNLSWAEHLAKPGQEFTVSENATLSGMHKEVVWVTVKAGCLRYLEH